MFDRVQEKGVKLKTQKCEINIREGVYSSNKITKDGIKPDESKMQSQLAIPTKQKGHGAPARHGNPPKQIHLTSDTMPCFNNPS